MSSEYKKKNHPTPINILKKVGSHLSANRKKELNLVFVLSIFASLAESISIAALIPFISFFINPETYLFNNFFNSVFNFFNISTKREILATVSLIFVFIIMTGSFLKIKFMKLSNSLTENIASDFRKKIFAFLINQDFSYYFRYGSKDILSFLSQKTGSFTVITFAAINILNSLLISAAIITVLVINEPFYTPVIISSIILFFFIIFKIKANSVLQKGHKVNINQNFIVNIFESTVGYLPEIIIYNFKKFYSTFFNKVSEETAVSASEIRTIGMLPRIYLETFVIVFVITFIYFSGFADRALEANISYLAILAFGAQKTIPQINSMYNFAVKFKGVTPTILTFLDILKSGRNETIDEKEYKILSFKKSIVLENISFRYNKNLPSTFKNISLEIKKGEKVAIKGETGSGKSTLINIISGLIDASEGKIRIDDTTLVSDNKKNWQKNIAIVPQTIFLTDATIIENIAIGTNINEIDKERAQKSAQIAQIDDFIKKLPNKYNECVGERGVRLSGGQRQRIGIARALYRDSKIIILDEPTNALDLETENTVMNSIIKLKSDITIIMVSHSTNSLKYFDKIINLDNFK